MQPKVTGITRETEWTRTYQTTGGLFVDSKYRTHECDVPIHEFARRWLAGDRRQRAEMEVAFQFYPKEDDDDPTAFEAAMRPIADADRAAAGRLRKLVESGIQPPAWHLEMLDAITAFCRRTGQPNVTVASNRWFNVLRNPAGLAVTVNPDVPPPSAEEVESLLPEAAGNRAYRAAIRWVLRYPSLVNGKWLPR